MGPGFESLKVYQYNLRADMAELADALDLGSSVFDVGVQVPLSAPRNLICGSGSEVERCLAKADIAGSNPVSRSITLFERTGYFHVVGL